MSTDHDTRTETDDPLHYTHTAYAPVVGCPECWPWMDHDTTCSAEEPNTQTCCRAEIPGQAALFGEGG